MCSDSTRLVDTRSRFISLPGSLVHAVRCALGDSTRGRIRCLETKERMKLSHFPEVIIRVSQLSLSLYCYHLLPSSLRKRCVLKLVMEKGMYCNGSCCFNARSVPSNDGLFSIILSLSPWLPFFLFRIRECRIDFRISLSLCDTRRRRSIPASFPLVGSP